MAVYRPKYKDPKTGELKQAAVYWYDFVRDGQRYRESTDVENKREAEAIDRRQEQHSPRRGRHCQAQTGAHAGGLLEDVRARHRNIER